MIAAFTAAWRLYRQSGQITPRVVGLITGGLVPLTIALIFLFNFNFGSAWPVLLVVLGVGMLLRGSSTNTANKTAEVSSWNARDLQQHVMILGWVYIIGHAILLAIGAFLFILLTGIGLVVTPIPRRGWCCRSSARPSEALLILLGLPGVAAGDGLLPRPGMGPHPGAGCGASGNLATSRSGRLSAPTPAARFSHLQRPAREYFEQRRVATAA